MTKASFPWRRLLERFGKGGVVIRNWPEGIALPPRPPKQGEKVADDTPHVEEDAAADDDDGDSGDSDDEKTKKKKKSKKRRGPYDRGAAGLPANLQDRLVAALRNRDFPLYFEAYNGNCAGT